MKFVPCSKCIDGYIFDSKTEEATKCNCLKDYQTKRKLEIAIERSNIPFYISENRLLIDYSLDDYIGKDKRGNLSKVNKFISDFDKYHQRNLFLSGKPGTQKSTVSRFIGMELLKQGYSVYYFLADQLVRNLIDSDRDDIIKMKMDRIITCDCLIIDEFSQDKMTTYKSGWQNTFLLPFLKRRIEFIRKSIIFISNSPIENIGTYFKGATQDLVYREVADKEMIFEDNYEIEKTKFDPKTLWE
jgi:DNA replication protein DnaC